MCFPQVSLHSLCIHAILMVYRLVDESDKDVAPGKPGEALLKGPMVTKGYHNNSEANKSSFTSDGWFRSGDILTMQGDLLYVVDRRKVIRASFQHPTRLTVSRSSSNTRAFRWPRLSWRGSSHRILRFLTPLWWESHGKGQKHRGLTLFWRRQHEARCRPRIS